MFDVISRNDPPPITHPGFFFGFASAALARRDLQGAMTLPRV